MVMTTRSRRTSSAVRKIKRRTMKGLKKPAQIL
jgi:hypothetical protein